MKQLALLSLAFFLVLNTHAQEKPEGLFINSKAYDFKAQDQNGHDISLKDLRKKGSVVVLFYRGYWCPFCNRELRRFEDSLALIRAKGAQLIAITPEAQSGIDSTIARTGASFPILYDEDMKISNNYHVSFQVDDRTLGRYKNAGIDLLDNNHQKKEAYLPVPAVYVINTEGSVVFRYFDADYKKRVSVKDILAAIP